jgi:hypothetical protein
MPGGPGLCWGCIFAKVGQAKEAVVCADIRHRADRLLAASRGLSPTYDRAVREEDMSELLMIRHQMAAAVRRADRLLADAITANIERRLADDR